jgi:hypothetical protein
MCSTVLYKLQLKFRSVQQYYITLFSNITPCSLVDYDRRFGGRGCVDIRDRICHHIIEDSNYHRRPKEPQFLYNDITT